MVTIYDVAHQAGVSASTVSRVINGKEYVRDSTRVKVEKAIRKLQYVPNIPSFGSVSYTHLDVYKRQKKGLSFP